LEQQKIFGTANWNAWKKANMSINENDDTIRRLLLNDVNDFEHLQLSLDVIDRVSVQECAAALRQNTSAEHFVLHDGIGTTAKMDKSDWVPFWNAISNHSAVHDITLAFAGTRSDSFLAAIAESASIKDVTLYKVVVNAMSLGAFFRTNTSVTHLKLTELRFRGTLYSETAAHVAASMAENTNSKAVPPTSCCFSPPKDEAPSKAHSFFSAAGGHCRFWSVIALAGAETQQQSIAI
jgi:hypothetical protein